MLIVIKGAGDLASGVAVKLQHCGFQVVMTEIAQPTTVRCNVAFSRCVYQGECQVEDVAGALAATYDEAKAILAGGRVAVMVADYREAVKALEADLLIEGTLCKRNSGLAISDAPLIVALGPGFTAGEDCHAVIETQRGHDLGRVIYQGSAVPDTGIPGNIAGFSKERILRASAEGEFIPCHAIGDLVEQGEQVATVNGVPVCANISGVIRGLLPAGTPVVMGMKSGDVDPRGVYEYCFTVSDKARCIAGGALEAVLYLTR